MFSRKNSLLHQLFQQLETALTAHPSSTPWGTLLLSASQKLLPLSWCNSPTSGQQLLPRSPPPRLMGACEGALRIHGEPQPSSHVCSMKKFQRAPRSWSDFHLLQDQKQKQLCPFVKTNNSELGGIIPVADTRCSWIGFCGGNVAKSWGDEWLVRAWCCYWFTITVWQSIFF